MIGPGFAARAIGPWLLMLLGVAFLAGSAVMWGLPHLWHWIQSL